MEQEPLTEHLGETLAVFDGAGEPRTTPEVADRLDLGRRTAYARLERLVDRDRLKTKKVGANARVWWRPRTATGESGDDDTEGKRSEQATRWEQQFRSLVEATDEYAIFMLDSDGCVQTWNPGAERIKGYDADEILGTHFSTFYTEDDRTAGVPEENLHAAAEAGSTQDEGWRLRNDGSRFWANVTITAIRDDDGALIGYAKVTRDMTDRRHAEAERELQSKTTRDIAEADTFEDGLQAALRDVCELTDWEYAEVWLPTDEGRIRRADIEYYEDELAEFAAFTEGYTLGRDEGLPGRVWASGEFEWMANLPTGSPEAYPRRERALDVDLKSSLGVPIVADGEVVAVLTFLMSAVRDTDERLVEIVSSVAADLGNLVLRRQVEREMEHERDLIDQILTASPVGIEVLNRDGEVTRTNARARDIFGISEGRAESYSPTDRTTYDADGNRVSPDDHPFLRALATGEAVFDWQVRVEIPDGEHRWLTVNAAPVLDADGEVERVVTTSEDITPIKEQARRLERQRDEMRAELDDIFARIDEAFFALNDDNWRITYINDRAAELVRLPVGELLQARVWDVLPEMAEGYPREMAERAIETQESVEFEFYSEILDTWIEIRGYPDETGLSVYVRDITERKARERKLERTRDLLEQTERIANVGGWEIDTDTMDVFWTDHLFDLLGVDYDEEPPLDEALDVYHEDDRSIVKDAVEAALDSGDPFDVEVRFRRPNGEVRWSRVQGTPTIEGGDVVTLRGAVQDVTDRRTREHVLRDMHGIISDRQQSFDEQVQALLELGRAELDTRYGTLSEIRGDEYVFEVVATDGDGIQAGDVVPVSATNCEIAASTEQTLVIEDVERDAPEETDRAGYTEWGISCYLGGPVFVDNEVYGTFCFYDTVARTEKFSEWEVTLVDLMSRWVSYELQRRRANERLQRQNEQLAALNSLNDVVREITGAVIEQSTREEIEATVCERLAETDSYLLAWIGDVDTTSQTVNLHAEAGVEGYLDNITISVDPDDERSEGPTGRALRTGDIQVVNDVQTDSQHHPWRKQIEEYDFRSSAAIPIVHEETIFGVLNVYAERPNAFTGQEREMIAQLGEIVGHAIAAAERKQALMSDELVELSFQIQDVFGEIDTPVEWSGTMTIDHMVAVGNGEYLVYGTATPDALDDMTRLVEMHPYWESVTVHSEGDPSNFELRMTDPPILSAVASRGGYVDRAVIENGTLRITIHLAPTVDVRQVIDAVREVYPKAEMLRRQQISRDRDDPRRFQRRLVADLTDRQRTALEVAYYAGFFEWPRDTTGEEVAESMGVTPPTFHQHFRKAERKVFDSVFSSQMQSTE